MPRSIASRSNRNLKYTVLPVPPFELMNDKPYCDARSHIREKIALLLIILNQCKSFNINLIRKAFVVSKNGKTQYDGELEHP